MTEQTITELTNFFKSINKETIINNCQKQSNLSFDKACEYFFRNAEERGLASATKSFYKDKLRVFGKYLALIKKKENLETVTDAELRHYINTKYSKLSAYTLNCHSRALRTLFNYLEKDGYLLANPCRNIRPKKIRREKIDYLTIDQVRKLLSSFDTRYKSEIRNLLIIMILLDTGVRNGELVRIKIEDFNFRERSIYVYATKTNTFRTVYYSKETEKLLNVYRREVLKDKENGPLFLKFQSECDEPTSEGLCTDRVYNILRHKALKIFGTGFRLNPHKFRHTFATHFVINGGDPFSLRELLGHTSIETTKIYVDMSPKDLRTKHAKHSLISNMNEQEGVKSEY